jgi:hypothetical protein
VLEAIAETKRLCVERLHEPDLAQLARAVQRTGLKTADCVAIVHAVSKSRENTAQLERLKSALESSGQTIPAGLLERLLLIHAALHALERIPTLPVTESVKVLFCHVFRSLASPAGAEDPFFSGRRSRFGIFCKFATLHRFPAGDFDWEVSGLPRSWLIRLERGALVKAVYVIARKFRGFAPAFVPHLGVIRAGTSLSVVEHDRSLYRMAQSMALQPTVKGLVASSWIRSPDTHRVSPHLGALHRVFVENGGIVVRMGPADPNSGVLGRSSTRRRLYEAGAFKPTLGLVLWPRREMLAWAAAHPELES